MNNGLKRLSRRPQVELDELFTKSPAGEVPNGRFDGIFLVAPGTVLTARAAVLIDFLLWQGKVFDAPRARVNNLILPFGFEAVQAKVYKAESRFDGRECIILDYSATSFFVRCSATARRQLAGVPRRGLNRHQSPDQHRRVARAQRRVPSGSAPGRQQPAQTGHPRA